MPLPIAVGYHIVPVPLRPRLSIRICRKGGRWRLHKDRQLVLFPQRIPVIRLWSLPATSIDVSAVSKRPWIEALFLPVASPTNTRFANIVKSCPDKIPDNVWVVDHVHPTIKCFQRVRLRAVHDPFGKSIVVKLVEALFLVVTTGRIVVSSDVEGCEVRILSLIHI